MLKLKAWRQTGRPRTPFRPSDGSLAPGVASRALFAVLTECRRSRKREGGQRARASRLRTVLSCQSPPLAVRTPRSLNACARATIGGRSSGLYLLNDGKPRRLLSLLRHTERYCRRLLAGKGQKRCAARLTLISCTQLFGCYLVPGKSPMD
jgi:hypothetical protein